MRDFTDKFIKIRSIAPIRGRNSSFKFRAKFKRKSAEIGSAEALNFKATAQRKRIFWLANFRLANAEFQRAVLNLAKNIT